MSVTELKTNAKVKAERLRTGLRGYYGRHNLTVNISALIALFVVVVGWQWVVVTVPAGFVAAKYYRLAGGTDTQEIYGEGSHLKLPWDKTVLYQVRLQEARHDFDVLTRDGLMMTVSIACRFRLNVPAVGWLHRNIGPDYLETLIATALGSHTRLIISRNSTDELYSERRAAIQEEIKRAVTVDIAQRTQQSDAPGRLAVLLDDVLILSVRFPPTVQAAIDRKMEQYQLREEYSYRIQREELESKRKEIEARGIAQFQSIVGAGISDNYLRWKSIDATLALAQSPNTKVVVIGKNSVPLFLSGDDTRSAPPASSDPNAAQVRAETPLSGPVTAPSGRFPEANENGMPWFRWLTSRVGWPLTVPTVPREAVIPLH
jgi:regulator of protease activity HflC (stomatin/prohibitin superfamily)